MMHASRENLHGYKKTYSEPKMAWYTLMEHQLVLTIAIFQRILITMDVYEI